VVGATFPPPPLLLPVPPEDEPPLEEPENPEDDPPAEPLDEPDVDPLEDPPTEPEDEPAPLLLLVPPLLLPLSIPPLLLPLSTPPLLLPPLSVPPLEDEAGVVEPPSTAMPSDVVLASVPAAQAATTPPATNPRKEIGRSQDTFM
jgi:hypothetical protein